MFNKEEEIAQVKENLAEDERLLLEIQKEIEEDFSR